MKFDTIWLVIAAAAITAVCAYQVVCVYRSLRRVRQQLRALGAAQAAVP